VNAFPLGGRIQSRLLKTLLYAFLCAYGLVALYPLFLVITSSFRTTPEIFENPVGLPSELSLDAYRTAWEVGNFDDYLWNSIVVTVTSVAITLVVGSLAAYPLGRHEFRGRRLLFVYFLSGLMLPIKLGIVPLFFLMRDLGLYDTRTSLVLLYSAWSLPFAIFVLAGFFRTLPADLEEAARIDGAGEFRIYWKVMLPLIRPALATVAIFSFIQLWNDFFFPLVLIQTDDLRTIPAGLANFFGTYENDWATVFAGLTISSAPLVVLFLLAARHIVKGLTAGAVKG
jgi:raffinose/stachyose/melibiose transport system permease protein